MGLDVGRLSKHARASIEEMRAYAANIQDVRFRELLFQLFHELMEDDYEARRRHMETGVEGLDNPPPNDDEG